MTIRNDDVKTNDNNKKKLKFLFIGRTASGKSSIAKEVCRRLGLKQVKSYTTRPKREGETEENSDHYFVTKDDFDFIMSDSQVNNGIAAYTEINGYEYCTTIDILDDSDIYVIDPDGVEYLKNHCTNKYDFIEIYFRIPYSISEKRFVDRGGTKQEFKRRYDKESEQFGEYEKLQKFHYHILNDKSFEESVNTVCKWILKEMERHNE